MSGMRVKNLGKTFLKLIDKHFPKTCRLLQVFTAQNNRILSEQKTQDQPKYNCRQKHACPLEGNCLDKELIYLWSLKENNISDGVNNNGLTEKTFKDQFYENRNSFKY